MVQLFRVLHRMPQTIHWRLLTKLFVFNKNIKKKNLVWIARTDRIRVNTFPLLSRMSGKVKRTMNGKMFANILKSVYFVFIFVLNCCRIKSASVCTFFSFYLSNRNDVTFNARHYEIFFLSFENKTNTNKMERVRVDEKKIWDIHKGNHQESSTVTPHT